MFEYTCLDCDEYFELGIDARELVRCPNCLHWRGIKSDSISDILNDLFQRRELEDAF